MYICAVFVFLNHKYTTYNNYAKRVHETEKPRELAECVGASILSKVMGRLSTSDFLTRLLQCLTKLMISRMILMYLQLMLMMSK